MTRVIVTDRRILVHRVDGQWLTFTFGSVAAVYPELPSEALVLQFPDTSPLRIQGPASAVASVVAVWHMHGNDGLLHHPGLNPIRSPETRSTAGGATTA